MQKVPVRWLSVMVQTQVSVPATGGSPVTPGGIRIKPTTTTRQPLVTGLQRQETDPSLPVMEQSFTIILRKSRNCLHFPTVYVPTPAGPELMETIQPH